MRTRFSGRTVLITGGAGSIGLELARQLLETDCGSIRLLDSSEHGLYEAKRILKDPRLRYLQGDIRDADRMDMAMKGVDYVIACAALKSVDIAEENPFETVSVNIGGTFTTMKEAADAGVSKCLVISSDKSLLGTPGAGVYHATKHIVEKGACWMNFHSDETKFSVVRPCNFVSSSMSAFESWFAAYKNGRVLELTDIRMERYFIPLAKAASFTLRALEIMKGGEIFVPPGKLFRMKDLLDRAKLNYKVVGMRRGEFRLKEELMTPEEKARAKKVDGMWVVNAS